MKLGHVHLPQKQPLQISRQDQSEFFAQGIQVQYHRLNRLTESMFDIRKRRSAFWVR